MLLVRVVIITLLGGLWYYSNQDNYFRTSKRGDSTCLHKKGSGPSHGLKTVNDVDKVENLISPLMTHRIELNLIGRANRF